MSERLNDPPPNDTSGTAMSSQTTEPLLIMRNLKAVELSPMDALLKKVNGGGLYQWVTFGIFSLHWFIMGWFFLSLGFYFEEKDFTCPGIPDQQQCTDFVCNNVPWEQWKYYIEGQIPSSLIYEWQPYMICEYSYVKAILQSLIAAGSMIGFFLFPYYADNYGRKISIIAAWLVSTIGIALLSFANGWVMVGIGYFLIGFGGNPAITLDFSFINEESLGRTRQYFSIGVQIFFALAESLVGIVLYQLHDWRLSMYIMFGLTAAVNFTHFYLIETPKFMMSKDITKCTELFNQIAKINNRQPVT